MRLLSSFMGLALLSGVLATTPNPTQCNANNCARAVTGTRSGKMPAVSSRQADCSSFMKVTVTPATSTATSTTTVTVTSIMPNKRDNLAIRQVTVVPSSIPAYASDCSSAAAYSSACSCWGITATTTTAPTPVTTITVTTTVTVSACSAGLTQCSGACKDLSTDPSNCGACDNVVSSPST
ncbi:hypothetical protein GE09DRAFT_1106038 [Coniochaeta sp. 2T2.1]|nr:hypothetical protein GE09DRAFT_1106038 [Coniochaeta sp. 2T2.1]